MFTKLVSAVFGSKQSRDLKRLRPTLEEVNAIYEELASISDEELRNKTNEFRRLLNVGPRFSRKNGLLVHHEPAEEFLRTHPDVKEVAFVGTRRDALEGDLVAWVVVREPDRVGDDLATQVRGGMARLGSNLALRAVQSAGGGQPDERYADAYQPKYVYFVDELPRREIDGEEKIDFPSLYLATEQTDIDDWLSVKWSEVEASLKREEVYTVDELLPEAFAAIKETCRRHHGKKWMAGGAEVTWEMVPFDVQIMGAAALAKGNIAEMATGEGKTLTATMPLYLHGLTCRGSQLITVNDYLAKRDAEWNGPIFEFLGMTVDCLDKSRPNTFERRSAYGADITYGTVNEFGFDYLRDNMARHRGELVQRDHYFAIIDEVDSVLIDEARTPLIISGPVQRATAEYDKILPPIRDLVQKQNMLVARLAKEAEELLEKDDDESRWMAGYRLLQCYKGSPKHKRYMKLRQEPGNQRLQEKLELQFLAEKKMPGADGGKRLRELEDELYFLVDEKHRQIELTEKGRTELSPENPEYFVVSDIVDEFAMIEQNEEMNEEEKEEAKRESRRRHEKKGEELHAINQLLHAFILKVRDIEYVVEDNKVVIVDENTGRKMPGRRWSDGLHQAVEAKENVKIEAETQTLATITIQNYFRLYDRLSGMTGTAETEASEFHSTYKMDVIVIPSNRSTERVDLNDLVYRTKRAKYAAVLEEVERLHKMELPVLVGTTNVQDSEKLSRMFDSKKLKHNVLNAKNHAQEAHIVADAGRPGAITIATNMAGRGTDIKLGAGVKEPREDADGHPWPGGLQIIGTERHESRRIDRQLRGRAGRQGDPGTSRFFVSLEDNLMLWFGSERIAVWLERLGMKEDEVIENKLVTSSIEKAQKKVEMVNHERRQRTLKFDDVMNGQRKEIYTLRRDILVRDDVRPVILSVFEDAIDAEFRLNFGSKSNMGDADITGWLEKIHTTILTESLDDLKEQSWADYEPLHEAVMERIARAFDDKMESLAQVDARMPDRFCRFIGLSTIDSMWQDHLLAIDDLREGVNLRSYGQKDPLVEFTKDATMLFDEFMLEVNRNIFGTFFRAQPMSEEEAKRRERERVRRVMEQKASAASLAEAQQQQAAAEGDEAEARRRPKTGLQPYRREIPKVGRNEPCPCGSGKKYKDCHGSPDMRERVQHTVGGGEEPEN